MPERPSYFSEIIRRTSRGWPTSKPGEPSCKNNCAESDGCNGGDRIFAGKDYARTLSETGIVPETIKSLHGLQYVRRVDTDGHHYFILA